MYLKTDNSLPDFSVLDIFGRELSHKSLLGKKVFIGFYRHAGCPFCNVRIHELLELQPLLEENKVWMVMFFESTSDILRKSVFHMDLKNIYIVSDPAKHWYAQFGVEQSWRKSIWSHFFRFVTTLRKAHTLGLPMHLMASGESFATMPAEFLVSINGKLIEVHYANHLNDYIPIPNIINFAITECI